jgi:hypothetical protein
MRTFDPFAAALFAAIAFGAACGGGGGEAGPRMGTPEWSWQAALENQEAGDFKKAVEHLTNLIAYDSELKNRAILWRAVLQDGLARGHQELAESIRLGIKEEESLAAQYQNALQQAYRDGRQFSIAFVESLGDLEKALSAPSVALDFPFPAGAAAKPAGLSSIEKGESIPAAQLPVLTDSCVRRGAVLAATELAGKGEAANEAQSAFEAGPVTIDPDKARLCVAKMLLDRSVLFDRLRLYQPDIRKILVDRAEAWSKPYLESENEELKKRAEQLQKEIEDERLELDGKRRRLEVRG